MYFEVRTDSVDTPAGIIGDLSRNDVSQRLPSYLAGTLKEVESKLVQEHLVACPMCQEKFKAMQKIGMSRSTSTHASSIDVAINVFP